MVVALFLFGALIGTAAHLPVPVTVVAGIAIAAWLLIFLTRERRKAGSTTKGAGR
ncbi:hypothetical protein ACWCO0_03040 [Streptomyces tubercidicus]|uniref:hypothetical protein n=1 Tax=Streptomyces tubercidicus TaxID=47759 RepID=UPI00142EF204|nr:hypothetical protein [Streptomyces tubercidicus]WAU16847.1 hypothetical protein STRTU_006846 [Streptomyces tubercidicus]